MSTMTVMDKSIKSSAHVKYPTEKDRPRGAGLNLVASRGTWVSESPVLQVEPMHPGAHHYRIHLWDGHKPIRAEKSAALYARTAPMIAHAWHMPGHTYTELKRYADAAIQQEG